MTPEISKNISLLNIIKYLEEDDKDAFSCVKRGWNRIAEAPQHVLASPFLSHVFARCITEKISLNNYTLVDDDRLDKTKFTPIHVSHKVHKALVNVQDAASFETAEQAVVEFFDINPTSKINLCFSLAEIALKFNHLSAAKKYLLEIFDTNEIPADHFEKQLLQGNPIVLRLIEKFLLDSNIDEALEIFAKLNPGTHLWSEALYLLAKTNLELVKLVNIIEIFGKYNPFEVESNENWKTQWVSCVRGIVNDLRDSGNTTMVQVFQDQFSSAFLYDYRNFEVHYYEATGQKSRAYLIHERMKRDSQAMEVDSKAKSSDSNDVSESNSDKDDTSDSDKVSSYSSSSEEKIIPTELYAETELTSTITTTTTTTTTTTPVEVQYQPGYVSEISNEEINKRNRCNLSRTTLAFAVVIAAVAAKLFIDNFPKER